MSKQTDIIQISVYVDGNEIDTSIPIHEINIEKATHEFSTASLVILLADRDDPFRGREIDDFEAGKALEIKDTSTSPHSSLFKGFISRQGIKILDGNLPALSISCKDKNSVLDQEKKTKLFSNQKDSEVINKILGDLGIDKSVEASQIKHSEIFQYQLSDWEMILRLAAKNNMLVFSEQEKITLSSPKLGASAVLELSYGDSILDMDVQEDTDHQYRIVPSSSKTSGQGKDSISHKEATDLVRGKLSGGGGLKNTAKDLSTSSKNTASTKNVKINEQEMAQLRGRICIHGNAKIKLGDMISLKGLGNKYSGKAFLRGIEHRIEAGSWITYLSIGMPEHWQEIPASGPISPNPNGLQAATVLKLENDPAGAYRIKVHLSGMEENEGLWAKISQFSASNNSGAFFLPEIGDEVVIGFEEGTEVSPIVLGMLYNQQHSPPLAYSDKNPIKQVKTRSGHSLVFDDDQKSVELKTADGQRIFLDSNKILLEDQKKNKVSIDSSGISLESKSNITLKADKDISLQANANISIKANANLDLQGLNVNHKAQAKFSASGGAGAELKTSAIALIQGSLVKIN